MPTRREILITGAGVVAGSALLGGVAGKVAVTKADAAPNDSGAAATAGLSCKPVVTPNVGSLPWTLENGVKVFRLVAEPVKRELAPGLTVNAWGYNGQCPGPTIEAVEGDRVRLLVTNKLPAPTSVHWHGVLLPNGMDGVAGLHQPAILPGETYAYEFTLRQHGTLMYHPHHDEMVQIALGMMGFFVVHPRTPRPDQIVDRDYAIFLHEWAIEAGASTPDPNVMLDFNYFTFNGRVYPGTAPLVAQVGERVRLRIANVSMDSHPIHIHGVQMRVVGTDGGEVPPAAQFPETTVNVPPGTTRTIELVPEIPGDWPLHCHKSHHTMNGMAHGLPNVLGVKQDEAAKKVEDLVPGFMAMGESGMHDMADMDMGGPKNTIPMMAGDGPFGPIGMGGMFTLVKVREKLTGDADPGWYKHPEGSVAKKVS